MSDRMVTKSLSKKNEFTIKQLSKKMLSSKRTSKANVIRSISKSDLMIAKRLSKKFASLTNVIRNIDALDGVVKLYQLTKK